jgi:hypothetical protein
MNHRLRTAVLLASLGLAAQCAHAEENASLNDVTAQDLLKLLVDEGVIDKNKLKSLTQKIQERKKSSAGAAVESVASDQRDARPPADGQVVRVPYVPKYIKDEIRDQVRIGLKEDVSRDVLAQAKNERWGLPGALPEWISRIEFSGDARLRYQGDMFADGNRELTYIDIHDVNDAGDIDKLTDSSFLNTTEDRDRMRVRMRLGAKAKITNSFEAGLRLVTGNGDDPVSTNQTLANYGKKYQSTFDLAYIGYKNHTRSVQLSGGRIKNPFLSTDLVWDNDLTFEGIAGTWHWLRSDGMDEQFRSADPYITLGAFPLTELESSSDDKWLYAAQFGLDYAFADQSKLQVGAAYYHYANIVGVRNDPGNNLTDYSAVDFVQKGNSLFNIRNDPDNTNLVLLGLLPDYHLANVTLAYDLATLAPHHIYLTADYVKNIGFDQDDIIERRGSPIDEETTGWLVRAAVGWPVVAKRGNWLAALSYRYLERDAVLDAFTDSDFHLGGTDAKGYVLEFQYGLDDDIWLTTKWMSSDEVEGDLIGGGGGPFGIDTIQFDLNAKF